MRINIKCSTAIHILLMVAIPSGQKRITSEYLASSIGSNPVEIRKLLSSMKKADLIEVSRGPGGAKLKKDPKDISLLDIYNAVDSASLNELIGIHSHPTKQCPFGRNINDVLSEPYKEIGETVREKMASITLDQLCLRLKELEPEVFKQDSII